MQFEIQRKFLVMLLVLSSGSGICWGQASDADTSAGDAPQTVSPEYTQLFDQMGPYDRKFQTRSPEAEKYLIQGMVWMHGFNFDEAIRSFLHAAELDPECAWAWWGVAYCEGPNYNDPRPDKNRLKAAWYALQNAVARSANASELERDLITALKSRYSNHWSEDRSELDQAFADAMQDVWKKHADDVEVGTILAAALMQLKPWKLYTDDREPQEGTVEIRKLLERVMQLDPQHAGAKHLYIHVVEPSNRPEDALAAANGLDDLVPDCGHLLHMPSHIYVQTGHWQKAIDQNVKAVEADRRYREESPVPAGQYGYQFHNSHMLAFSAMMVGQETKALEYANEMWAVIPEEKFEELGPGVDFTLMSLYDVQKRFGRWDKIIKSERPPESLILTTAYWHAHRAIAYAAMKQFDDANHEYVAFLNAKEKVPANSEEENFFFQRALDVAERFIKGEIALQQEDWPTAIWHLEQAAKVEDTLLYSEPPYWLQPVRHTLGAVYMKAKQYEKAEETYREDLRRWKDNGWSLYGLSEALKAQHKHDQYLEVVARFNVVWANADDSLLTSCKCIQELSD